jgi:hypothetical protein
MPYMTTGSSIQNAPNLSQTFTFGPYEIVIAMTPDKRFIGVIEVRQRQDFRDAQQRIDSIGYLDVDQYIHD